MTAELLADMVLNLTTVDPLVLPEEMGLTRATAEGVVLGYRVQAQRRSMNRNHFVCIRLSAPDGRVLNVRGWSDRSATDARTPTSGVLSRTVALAFSPDLDPDRSRMVADRVEAVIAVGRRILADASVDLREAFAQIGCAAEGVDRETVAHWNAVWCRLSGMASHVDDIDAVSARAVERLMRYGFTPETSHEWLIAGLARSRSTAGLERCAALFRDRGWSAEQFGGLVGALERARLGLDFDTSKIWVRLGPEAADLAIRAGLTAREAGDLVRAGAWDVETVQFMAALRGEHVPYLSVQV